MRTLLLLGLAIGGAFMAGWFTIEREGDKTRIEINKTEIRSDTRTAIDRTRQIIDERQQQQQLAQQQQQQQPGFQNQTGYGANANGWPPQNGQPIQGAGYNAPNYNVPNFNQSGGQQQGGNFGNQNGYNPNAFQQPNYNQSQTGGQPRWDSATAPWQQQNR